MGAKSIWEPRTIYLYLVCLITLVMVIVSGVNAVRALVDLLYPEPELAIPSVEAVPAPGEAPIRPAEPETAEQERVRRAWTVRNAVLNLVGNVAMLLLAGPIYLYHWRRVREVAAAQGTAGPQT